MDKEIEFFIDFEDGDIEDNDNSSFNILKSKGPPPTAKQKITVTLFIVFVFALIGVFGYISMYGYDIKDETTYKQTTEVSDTEEMSVSEKYKIKVFSDIVNETVILRGRINITKDDLSALDNNDLAELFNYVSSLNDYNWTTICFSDGTGIFSLPENESVYLYGSLDENGMIKETYGTIIDNGKDEYIFISVSATNTTTDNTTDNSGNISITENVSDADTETVYITASGTKYHFGGCTYLTESKTTISLSKAKEQGYLPCSRCVK